MLWIHIQQKWTNKTNSPHVFAFCWTFSSFYVAVGKHFYEICGEKKKQKNIVGAKIEFETNLTKTGSFYLHLILVSHFLNFLSINKHSENCRKICLGKGSEKDCGWRGRMKSRICMLVFFVIFLRIVSGWIFFYTTTTCILQLSILHTVHIPKTKRILYIYVCTFIFIENGRKK